MHVSSVTIVTQKMFGYCGRLTAVSLFVNRSAMFVPPKTLLLLISLNGYPSSSHTIQLFATYQSSIISPLRECGTAGALVLYSVNIHFSPLRECGTAGALVLYPFNIHFSPLRECGTAGALVLYPFNIHFSPLRECGRQVFSVTQSWPGILKLLLIFSFVISYFPYFKLVTLKTLVISVTP